MSEQPLQKLRIDKWLWQARFFKTRARAAAVATSGRIRVNQTPIQKASSAVGPGDVLTFPQAKVIRVVRIMALGERRGPAPEAQLLYEDLAPEVDQPQSQGPRPSKKDRRQIQSLRQSSLE